MGEKQLFSWNAKSLFHPRNFSVYAFCVNFIVSFHWQMIWLTLRWPYTKHIIWTDKLDANTWCS